jgi:hypothetical protein
MNKVYFENIEIGHRRTLLTKRGKKGGKLISYDKIKA